MSWFRAREGGPGGTAAPAVRPPVPADPDVVIWQARARQRRRRRRTAAVVAVIMVLGGGVYLAVGGSGGVKPGTWSGYYGQVVWTAQFAWWPG